MLEWMILSSVFKVEGISPLLYSVGDDTVRMKNLLICEASVLWCPASTLSAARAHAAGL